MAASFYCSKLLLSILTIQIYDCISISEFPYQLKTVSKKQSYVLFKYPNPNAP